MLLCCSEINSFLVVWTALYSSIGVLVYSFMFVLSQQKDVFILNQTPCKTWLKTFQSFWVVND